MNKIETPENKTKALKMPFNNELLKIAFNGNGPRQSHLNAKALLKVYSDSTYDIAMAEGDEERQKRILIFMSALMQLAVEMIFENTLLDDIEDAYETYQRETDWYGQE